MKTVQFIEVLTNQQERIDGEIVSAFNVLNRDPRQVELFTQFLLGKFPAGSHGFYQVTYAGFYLADMEWCEHIMNNILCKYN